MSNQAIHPLLARKLAETYDTGAVLEFGALRHESLVSRNPQRFWHIATARGDFCLKQHRPGKPLHRIAFEQNLQNGLSLAETSIAPRIVPTNDGRSGFEMDDACWWLEEFIDSQHCPWWQARMSEAECRRLGAALALLHKSTAQLGLSDLVTFPVDTACGARAPGSTSTEFITDLNSIAHTALPDLMMRESSLAREQRMFDLTRFCARAEALIAGAQIDGLPKSLVHGDFHRGNVLTKANGRPSVIDFEHVHFENPMFDVGYALLMCCFDWEPSSEQSMNLTCAKALLQGYRGETEDGSLHPDDLSRLPAFIAVACALTINWLIDILPNALSRAQVTGMIERAGAALDGISAEQFQVIL